MPIEKIYEPEYDRPVLNEDGTQAKNEDGTDKVKRVRPWEIRATGKEVQELRGAFKDSAP